MEISAAQQDLSRAYVGGGPGVMVSGCVWLAAALIEHAQGVGAAFAALFLGGMAIFPVSKLVCRFGFGRANETPGNPFGLTVLEGTIAMIAGLFAAWLFLPIRPALVFPLAALAVGTHYFAFATCYGDRRFWILAAIVAIIGFADIYAAALHGLSAPLVAMVELGFGLLLTRSALKQS
jgi:hypothetical protein